MAKEIDAVSAAAWLKAVSNPARLRIALCLLKGEHSVTELEQELKLKQPNLSQHLAELRNANIAVARREVRSVYYSLAGEAARRFVAGLLESFGGAAPRAPLTSSTQDTRRPGQAAVFAKVQAS